MVFDSECMMTDPVSMLERCEREKREALLERRQHVERRFAKLEQQSNSTHGSASANICHAHPFVSECEALVALSMCNNDEARAARKLHNYDFLMQVRKAVCLKFRQPCMSKDEAGRNERFGSELDDPPDNADDEQRSWSASRRRSYKNVTNFPNAYFYSYTAPGEAQKHGAWSGEEHCEFLKHIEQYGGWEKAGEEGMRWGDFSRKIAGRAGYQCSNYYLHLRRVRRKLQDDNEHQNCQPVAPAAEPAAAASTLLPPQSSRPAVSTHTHTHTASSPSFSGLGGTTGCPPPPPPQQQQQPILLGGLPPAHNVLEELCGFGTTLGGVRIVTSAVADASAAATAGSTCCSDSGLQQRHSSSTLQQRLGGMRVIAAYYALPHQRIAS